ncbi:tyrosine-type recombinase/integrase [uncultured Thiodictyon sp.]|uniref:tyrosine-type recombinase/integrase n=1 Tax=uncultured Thiodictyon sp. TaxID=1846217 RepID=UPI0025D4C549|nr:tyrosine-type recombinase/integrase [uncultured Thiodictyon sp.]
MANRLRAVLKLAFDLAVRAGQVDSNPVISIAPYPNHKRDRYLTDAEYRAIWTAAPPALRAIMDLAYLTGQRISDVLGIHESDITPDGIDFRQQKTGKRLTITWSTPGLRAAVDTARALHPTRKLLLLGQRNGKVRGYKAVRGLWDRACQAAEVTDAHLHDIRAKSATDAKRQGLDPQRLMGHTTPGHTNRYLRGRDSDLVTGPSFAREQDDDPNTERIAHGHTS